MWTPQHERTFALTGAEAYGRESLRQGRNAPILMWLASIIIGRSPAVKPHKGTVLSIAELMSLSTSSEGWEVSMTCWLIRKLFHRAYSAPGMPCR